MHAKPGGQVDAVLREANDTAIYIRWSTDDQRDGTTLEVQFRACLDFCLRRGWLVPPDQVFIEDGVSGASLKRPVLSRVRAAVAKGKIKRLVVYRLDRFSRSTPDFNRLVREEWEDGRKCTVISATEGDVNVDNPQSLLAANILVFFAEYERLIIRLRTLSGKRRRAAEGKIQGGYLPYGYSAGRVKGTPVVVDHEAAIVKRIFDDCLSGLGQDTITRNLNEDGLRYRDGTPWNPLRVARILQQPAYMGVLAWGRWKYSGDRRICARETGDPDNFWVEGAYPALVSREIWESAKMARQSRTSQHRRPARVYLLSGLTRCARCAAPVCGHTHAGGERYYTCQNQLGCECGSIPADALENLVFSLIRERLHAGLVPQLMARAHELWEQHLAELRAVLSNTQAAIDQNKKRQKKLRSAFYDAPDGGGGDRAGELFKSEMLNLKRQYDMLTAQEREARERLDSITEAGPGTAWIEEAKHGVGVWECLEDGERKALFRQAIKSVTVFREKGSIGGRNAPRPLEVELHTRLEDIEGPAATTTPLPSDRFEFEANNALEASS